MVVHGLPALVRRVLGNGRPRMGEWGSKFKIQHSKFQIPNSIFQNSEFEFRTLEMQCNEIPDSKFQIQTIQEVETFKVMGAVSTLRDVNGNCPFQSIVGEGYRCENAAANSSV
jgi:hypothetical protein